MSARGADGRWMRVEHGFPPLFDARSRVLFLGTMASPKSREAGFFYMHPRNRFWPIMDSLFADPDDPADTVGTSAASRRAFALRHRFALWDTVESCEILGASDASIRDVVPSDLAPIVRGSEIRHIYPCGAKAAALYERYCRPMLLDDGIDLPSTPLPSTSPAYAARTLDNLIAIYREKVDMADFA
ncbi:uracil-DNA glycosylase family protein [Bifidobacterium castoris]|uniref:DNA-deoxyinosine glycosylase n=1 Tax=Bifidobacterium castoris TaxID=2306972 RepID=A0A430FAR1_9BIFI|nr:uracil-DNA glycosylase family protein [Bifidobacterium castoris]RSX49898.1 DNA-deoxyinosine glycosylase [Bifidobacterium castoris]